jgi:hypothetical protein
MMTENSAAITNNRPLISTEEFAPQLTLRPQSIRSKSSNCRCSKACKRQFEQG